MQLVEWIGDYITRARELMLQQFKREEAPNLDKLLQVIMSEIQVAENEINKLVELRSITTASGAQLDILGDIAGIDRQGRTDSEYRSAILVQIAVNNGGGQERVLSALLTNLTPPGTIIDIWEVFPAGLDIFVSTDTLTLSTIRSLRRAIAATVGLQFEYTPGGTPFAFEGGSFGAGFGSLYTSDGGEFATVIPEV